MTTIQIQYFMTVVQTLHFTRAAKKLFVSQQVVSKQIKNLEDELGFALFVRDTRGVQLSNGGKILYELWSRHEKEQNECIALARISNTKKKRIKIGILDACRTVDMILPLSGELEQKYPDIQWEYELGSFKNLQDAIDMKALDLVVTLSSDIPLDHPPAQQALLKDLELGIILADNHPLCRHKALTVEQLRDEVFFVLDESFSEGTAEKILRACQQLGFYPKEIYRFSNLNKMELALQSGRGVTIGYDLLFRNSRGRLKLFPIAPAPGIKKADLILLWSNGEFEEIARGLLTILHQTNPDL